ncbi:UDP-N-acetylmuramate dehydrogenase [Rudaea cellulosilytica]|uniref:UDP-N-acetylmuramate dehydrogenase n=1 Tax=Rudaea cellulosilytica TaxID=540746 RepID=UPI00036F74AA|nr:UDP-N-acetylmuramate dehydrogenase [Rudaea cellulosilytica]
MNDHHATSTLPFVTGYGYTVHENASMLDRTTFRVPARAAMLIDVHEFDAIPCLLDDAAKQHREVLILGGGSNVLFTRDWPGVVLALRTRGLDIIEQHVPGTPGDAALVRAAAGEVWDDFVHWTLAHGLRGLENLALIPGSVGATPIQNIGAYGVEVGEFVDAVYAYDRTTSSIVRLDRAACAFAYRDSLFKRDSGRYLITAVDFLLPRERALRLDYDGVREELAAMGVDSPDARAVAHAISRVRTRKLPDPVTTGNAGSFFKNPIVSADLATALEGEHARMPLWPLADGLAKLSAAWLIEACGLKGFRQGDAGVSDQHALVLINYGGANGAQLWALARHIQQTVLARFGVALEPEPLVI